MRPIFPTLRRLSGRVAREQEGFTLIELLSAVLVVSIGVIALITTFDTSRNLVSYSEAKETAAHLAEQELERLLALDYADVALDAAPPDCAGGPCTSPNQLAYYLGPPGWYRWDQTPVAGESRPAPRCVANLGRAAPITNCEELVVGAASPATASVPAARELRTTSSPTGGVRLQLELQRFVTYVDDDCGRAAPGSAAPGCLGDRDYKRITVAVRIVRADNGGRLERGPKQPVLLSAVVRP